MGLSNIVMANLAQRRLLHDAQDLEKEKQFTRAGNGYRVLSTHMDDPNKKAEHLLHAGELYVRAENYDAARNVIAETGALRGLNADNDARLSTLRSNMERYVLKDL